MNARLIGTVTLPHTGLEDEFKGTAFNLKLNLRHGKRATSFNGTKQITEAAQMENKLCLLESIQ